MNNINNIAKPTAINKPIIIKQSPNTFQKDSINKDPNIIKGKMKEIGKAKPNTLPPVSNPSSTSGSFQSNLLQKNSTPGISTTTSPPTGYSSGNPLISSPSVGNRQLKEQSTSSTRTTLTNSPGINTGMKGRGIINTQNLLEQNAEIYNYDIDKQPTYIKEKSNDRVLDESATINYDNKNQATVSRDGSEEGKSKSYGNLSNNEE